MQSSNLPDWKDRKLQEWLFLLLRYAVTRESSDRWAVLAMADELDSLGVQWRPGAPRFFHRTAYEVCEAIIADRTRHTTSVLRKHAMRIDNPRLRRAFAAAVDLTRNAEPQQP
jgi:hypothetical protein